MEGSFLHHFRKKVEPFIDPSPKPGTNAQCSEIMRKVFVIQFCKAWACEFDHVALRFGDQRRYNRVGR
jgi:hypothetical protein